MNQPPHGRRATAAANKALLVLASATPSLESYRKACEGTYTLVKLKNRYGGAVLPKTTIVDMRREAGGVATPIGSLLAEKLRENFKAGNQSILFLNRRGYNNILTCRDCGESVRCDRCSVSVTYHATGARYDTGILKCHWCGKRFPVPDTCPVCGKNHLLRTGYGTQRVEQDLNDLLPGARILRMDTDSTGTKNADELLGFQARRGRRALSALRWSKATFQMSPRRRALCDASLYLDDFRANNALCADNAGYRQSRKVT